MKVWKGAAWALGGAALSAAAIYIMPGWAPGSDKEGSGTAASVAADRAFGVVEADAETQKRADIRIAPLAASARGFVRAGYARALDLSALASINADYRAARSAAEASAKELARQKALFTADTSTSARAVEQAKVQAAADADKVTLACRRVALEYGAGLDRLGCPALDALLKNAAAGRAALLRLDFTDGMPRAGAVVTISGPSRATGVHVLGPAAAADTQLQTTGALAIVSGPAAAHFGVGQVFDAQMAGPGVARGGVIVPRSAILRVDGGLWIYRAGKNSEFERTELQNAHAVSDGWFVPAGLNPGEKVVVSGAGSLFGLERGSSEKKGD